MLVIIWSQTDTFLYKHMTFLYLPRHSAPSNNSSMETVTRSLRCSVVYRLCYGTLHAASDMLPFLLHLHHFFPPSFGTLRVGVDVVIAIHGYMDHLFSVR